MNDATPIDPGIGHNLPPLAEQLAEEVAPFRERRDALLESLRNSEIKNPEDAAAVTTLGGMLKNLRDAVETARKARAEPFDTGKAAVQRVFAADIIKPIDDAMVTARRMVEAWKKKLDDAAAAERRKRDAEAAAAAAAADELARQKREAEAAGDAGAALKAEIAEVQARDRAEALAGDEGTIRPEAMIRSQAGSAVFSTARVPVVTNIGACLAWMIVQQGPQLLETIAPLIARLVRAKVTIPGVEIREETRSQFRRG